MTILELHEMFGTDDRCREILERLRWPEGSYVHVASIMATRGLRNTTAMSAMLARTSSRSSLALCFRTRTLH